MNNSGTQQLTAQDSPFSLLKQPDLLRQSAFIAGEWRSSDQQISVTNPANGEMIASVPNFGADEARAAVDAAEATFGPWKRRTAKERAVILRRWSALIHDHLEDLAIILTSEQGKPLAEARDEVVYAASYLEWFSEEARRVDGDLLTPHRSDRRLLVMKQPVGVVAAITPWNFPLAMITRKAGPALAVGCTMVLKPASYTPLSALALAWLAQQAGVPEGVFNVVTGSAGGIGGVFTSDSRIRKLTFTGSTHVGKSIAIQCMDTVKRVSLELGGNAPFIVFDDADVDAAVDGAIASKFRNTGQTCVCTNRLLVQSGVYDQFAAKLAERVRAFSIGSGLDPVNNQGPLIDEKSVRDVAAHVDDAVARGATILVGGQKLDSAGSFYAPTVLANVPSDARLCHEETFGPVAGLVRFDTEAEALKLANDSSAGLAAYVYTNNASRMWRMPEELEYGMVGVNTGAISTEVAPFGGVKESGIGREGSKYGVEDYLELKTVCVSVEAHDV